MKLTVALLTVLACLPVPAWAAAPGRAAEILQAHGVDKIVFAARVSGTDHYYVNFGYYVNNPNRKGYRDGGRLCRLDVRTGQAQILLDDPKGGVRDPQMHYGGRKILFAYRKGGQPYYHLHEINVDGTGLRRLTDGPWDDIEPTYLPDGGIVFCSSRCDRVVACWYTPVVVLYGCDGDGRNIRALSSSIVHDNTPWVLPDGRVLYTRWEYVDRSRVQFHHLWTINPDGTGQMAYYGNQHGGTVMIDAKPIPGTQAVVASFSPGHGRPEHMGPVTVVDPAAGPDARAYARRITRDDRFHDPYPVAPDCFLVAVGKQIAVVDGKGAAHPLYTLPRTAGNLDCHAPRPLRPRPREKLIRPRIDLSKTTGTLILTDVTYGQNMAGVRRGEIKKLLVLEQLAKAVNFSGTMEPITIGGSFTLKRILGTVPVEPDGSAHFEVPALRSVFFVALDKRDIAVKRMQSFVTVQPGETTSCAGCHEYRAKTPPPLAEIAATQRPPSPIEPIAGVPDLIDFPRDIQPILDRHCVKCHDYGKTPAGGPRSGGAILTGDRSPRYSQAYVTLMTTPGLISHGRDSRGNMPPRRIGTPASRLMTKVDGSHHKVHLSPREHTLIRLWVEVGASYPATYAALGTGMVGVAQPPPEFETRCGTCHRLPKNHRRPAWGTRFGHGERAERLFNLTRPEKSLVLLAPLTGKAGGLGLCEAKAPSHSATLTFATTSDPLYQKLLAIVRRASADLQRIQRFDMPGFRPNRHYIRELQRIGILPKTLGPNDPIDPYAADQAYWKHFWHRPSRD